jgi:hypothetical protein
MMQDARGNGNTVNALGRWETGCMETFSHSTLSDMPLPSDGGAAVQHDAAPSYKFWGMVNTTCAE